MMLVPILVHWLLVVQVWLDDLRTNKTAPWTVVFLVLNCYSQFRLIRILIKWRKHEVDLQREIDEHDVNVNSLECVFEAVFQVCAYISYSSQYFD